MDDDCCQPEFRAVRAIACPLTGRPTKPVSRATVFQHVNRSELAETTFGFCDAAGCPVVYVGADGTLIEKSALRTRIGAKETSDPIPVCYCWSYTKRQIADDFAEHGRSTIRERIEAQVRAGLCRCEATNPSGRCCLGDVARAIAEAGGSP